jgi:hypothetical protein
MRRVGAVAVAALVVGGLAVAGASNGYPARDVRLLSGSAWLPSSSVGQLTLLDGSSAEVAAQVQVAPAGNTLDVVQQGANAYAVDRSVGTIRRVDGATFDLTQPESPILDARAGLTAFAATDALYVLDNQRGVVAQADPTTLARRGDPMSLAAQLSAGTATLDQDGRLWVVDNSTGDLISIQRGERTQTRGVTAAAGNVITMAGTTPVIVNAADRKVVVVDPETSATTGTIDLDLRPDDNPQISGSPRGQRIYVVAARGVLTICDVVALTCDGVVPLDAAGRELGAAVEAGDRLFIPDYTAGQVWVIDLSRRTVLTKAQVLPPTRFQLLARDGVVFFNDPDTERAGVVRLDGSVDPILKYDPKDPAKGLHASTSNTPTAAPTAAPTTAPTETSLPTVIPTTQPTAQPTTTRPTTTQPTRPTAPTTRPQNTPVVTVTTVPTTVPTQPTATTPNVTTPPTTTTPPKPVLQITVSKASPAVNESIGLQVGTASSATPVTATWDFGDTQNGVGVSTTHAWTAARTYQVSVQATMPDAQQATAAVSITVTPPPTVDVPDVIGMTTAQATAAVQAVGLVAQQKTAASNTVPSGRVMSQTPIGSSKVPPGSAVVITTSTGKHPVIDLMTEGPRAAWRSGTGVVTWRNQCDNAPQEPNGYAENCFGNYTMENDTNPNYIWSHPNWDVGGWITGTYTLPYPIIAGDHFRASVGFVKPISPPSKGDADFVVYVINGSVFSEVARVRDTGADGVLRPIDVDLTPYAGATGIQLRADSLATTAQDWTCWITPRIEG